MSAERYYEGRPFKASRSDEENNKGTQNEPEIMNPSGLEARFDIATLCNEEFEKVYGQGEKPTREMIQNVRKHLKDTSLEFMVGDADTIEEMIRDEVRKIFQMTKKKTQ